MSYCTQDDILEQLDEDVLIQLTDDDNVGVVDDDVVTRAIADADALIDSYCGTRCPVPFSTVPDIIRKLSVEIAIYHLYGRRRGAPEDRQKRYDDAVKFLENVSKKLVSLGADDPDAPPSDTNKPDIESNTRIFTRDKMSGF